MYDDDDDDEEDDEDEIDLEKDAETLRREGAEGVRGIEDRAFYDNLAKKEDDRHNAMRKDVQKRTLAVQEIRQKVRHQETEVKTFAEKIRVEEERILFEQHKTYRKDAQAISGGVPVEAPAIPEQPEVIPILSRDILRSSVDEEFSIERATAHIKQLEEERSTLAKVVVEMRAQLSEEERSLSQLEHQVARM